jgi:uncharacterized alpha-E superfamily protein
MLSRVADSLYWMSRYVERAETTARLLDVNVQLLLDFESLDGNSVHEHWESILLSQGCLGTYRLLHPQIDHPKVIRFLCYAPDHGDSILHCVSKARENARMVRDQISAEMWETLNEMFHLVRDAAGISNDQGDPTSLFALVREKSLLFQGLTEASFAHEQAYKFMQAGKFLERADQTSRMVDIQHRSLKNEPDENRNALQLAQWIAVLRTCSAFEAYHHRYLDQIQPTHLAEFLLLSPSFPRSVRFCVSALDYHMRGITHTREGEYSNAAEHLSGRLKAEICYTTIDDVLTQDLHLYIDRLQLRLIELNDALLGCYVHQPKLNIATFSQGHSQQQQQQ